MTSIPHKALVVIADGRKAILFRNTANDGTVTLHEEKRLSPKDLQGPSGSRPEEQTPNQTDEATFAKQLAETLNKMKNDHEFDAMVLAADPQTLGQLRDVMHKNVADSIVRSLPKDLTNHSTNDIASALNK